YKVPDTATTGSLFGLSLSGLAFLRRKLCWQSAYSLERNGVPVRADDDSLVPLQMVFSGPGYRPPKFACPTPKESLLYVISTWRRQVRTEGGQSGNHYCRISPYRRSNALVCLYRLLRNKPTPWQSG